MAFAKKNTTSATTIMAVSDGDPPVDHISWNKYG